VNLADLSDYGARNYVPAASVVACHV